MKRGRGRERARACAFRIPPWLEIKSEARVDGWLLERCLARESIKACASKHC